MTINEIKQQLPITKLVQQYDLKPDKHGFILYPFHDDHTPSLKINPHTNTFYCFGCGAGGDQIEFIQLKERCTKHEAIKKAETFITTGNHIIKTLKNKNLKNMEKQTFKTDIEYISRSVILMKYLQSCRLSMQHSKLAREYAESRMLNIEKLGIGFNSARMSDSWSNILKENAESIGLLNKNSNGSYTARFKNCLVFEIKDKEGRPVAIYGRSIEKSNEKHHVLMPGKLQGLYPNYPKAETEKLIITESIIDAATLLMIPELTEKYEILSAFGVNGLTEEHTEAIKQLPVLKEIIFAFDGDKAGREGIKRYGEILQKEKPEIKISFLEIC